MHNCYNEILYYFNFLSCYLDKKLLLEIIANNKLLSEFIFYYKSDDLKSLNFDDNKIKDLVCFLKKNAKIFNVLPKEDIIKDIEIIINRKLIPVKNKYYFPVADNINAAFANLSKFLSFSEKFDCGINPFICTLDKSFAINRQQGTQSKDGNLRWRLDFENCKGVHIDIEWFLKNADERLKIVIPTDENKNQYFKWIDLMNNKKRVYTR